MPAAGSGIIPTTTAGLGAGIVVATVLFEGIADEAVGNDGKFPSCAATDESMRAGFAVVVTATAVVMLPLVATPALPLGATATGGKAATDATVAAGLAGAVDGIPGATVVRIGAGFAVAAMAIAGGGGADTAGGRKRSRCPT